MNKLDYAGIDEYLHKFKPDRHPVLKSMEKYARHRRFPIIGPLAGQFLYQLALISGARKVLELGSGFGYSALWFAQAIGPRGTMTLTDLSATNREKALNYFRRAGLKTKIDFQVGEALHLASRLRVKYDIILNDIDKADYPASIDVAARLLKKGGLFVTDNIIWSGKVLDGRIKDKDTQGIRRFTEKLYKDKRFCTSIIPLRDGLALAVRL